ncbi:tryptophan-rich sensory protein [Belliella baltica DSM 15883]|uniref:Tryptophan-rich sensory protein n=1 Tax=Belliella baltica (strain DSM 15883 / CIP 108006 / LMG 21964 / BA134) TaxID=866536 RepID=I3Z2N5_BELBD|nr:TspO/MBR family protein [Belliella baltica]AFL83503.1 tryptophan-rich sensory protein [Belliella baltica DSM 15883]
MKNWLKLLISIILPQIAGGLGALVTISSVGSWYQSINKPFFNPPSWIFGPTWTVLYIMMGVSLFLIWKSNHPFKKKALWLFAIQLLLNAIWSPAFFGLESPILGLLVIVPLWVMILVCIRAFFPIDIWASYLLIPYLLWVSFATVLNASIWYLN